MVETSKQKKSWRKKTEGIFFAIIILLSVPLISTLVFSLGFVLLSTIPKFIAGKQSLSGIGLTPTQYLGVFAGFLVIWGMILSYGASLADLDADKEED